ncbi:sulfate transporter [Couchioplanes caeruleus subsp. caeruleus]|uniref:Sulfate transporter n=1 Tax=Couchioplanes caeruleus subsp. caeruleus TaxID=56427 RepID=A0A1K0FE78_9ACTN|nr:sulfate transporter [Couchioplanes caeruleus subsp. caeruleus]
MTVGTVVQDFLASIVVFLVALPLCIGVAVASGVSPEVGVITGIVGGIVAGMLPGSSLQVSGPAAGLTVLVFGAVQEYGVGALGAIVLGAGIVQIVMGICRIGRWFQAITLSVVQGMLAGIGLLILVGQLYPLADRKAPGQALANLAGIPELVSTVAGDRRYATAAVLGIAGLLIIVCWKYTPKFLRKVPGPLAAVVVVASLVAVFDLPVNKLTVGSLLDAVSLPTAGIFTDLADPGLVGMIFAFALIASAESLFSASAVDRMHTGPRTNYNVELVAQGAGNAASGLLGALPMTAVIVRSAANVHAGARTKLSRILHGVWMLLFVLAAPGLLSLIPITVLAAILVHSGWKLLNPMQFRAMRRQNVGEAVIAYLTTAAIIATDLLEGVVIGMVATMVKLAWSMSHMSMSVDRQEEWTVLRLTGSATFLRLPNLLEKLESLSGSHVHVDLSRVFHLDIAARSAIETWAGRCRTEGTAVRVTLPHGADPDFAPLDAH